MKSYSLQQLADQLGGCLHGDDTQITGLATLKDAGPGDLSFLANQGYSKQLPDTKAAAVLIRESELALCPCPAIVLDNPYLGYAQVSGLFDPNWQQHSGIHPSAIVDPGADVASDAYLAAGVVVAAGAVISSGAQLGANTVIGENSLVGERSRLAANVTVYAGISIGSDCVIHSGAVLGSDGFGFAPGSEGWVKIHQIGGVVIGNKVEIGAGTTIDRGALSDTVIEDGAILDNQIQIAHNVIIGKGCAIAATSAIAGSAELGAGCLLGGGVGVVGHVSVGAGSQISATTLVTKSIPAKSVVSSGMPMLDTKQWRRSVVRFSQLDDMAKRIRTLEKKNSDD